jgi:prepilin-type N-terminal cleavage/methylation domain-containing protein
MTLQGAGSRRGVTLIEVLIAVTLLSLLSAGMLVAMRVGVNAWGKANQRLLSNRRVAGAHRALESQIAGLMPVFMLCPVAPGGILSKSILFQGEPGAMRFVSSYSLQEAWRGRPRILEFSVIPREEGGVRLIVNEALYTGPHSAGASCLGQAPGPAGMARYLFAPVQAGPHSFVLADRLSYCRFAYLEPQPLPVRSRWRPDWVIPRWPLAVRIEMATLDEDDGQIHPVTITAPIRLRRWPELKYEDLQP